MGPSFSRWFEGECFLLLPSPEKARDIRHCVGPSGAPNCSSINGLMASSCWCLGCLLVRNLGDAMLVRGQGSLGGSPMAHVATPNPQPFSSPHLANPKLSPQLQTERPARCNVAATSDTAWQQSRERARGSWPEAMRAFGAVAETHAERCPSRNG